METDLITIIPNEYIPKYLINTLNKNDCPHLIEYFQINNEQAFNSKTDNKYEKTTTIDERILKEIIQIEDEKFKNIRQESNLNEETKDITRILKEYLQHNKILGLTAGLPGSGKSSFIKKHFPNNHISLDEELNKYEHLYQKATEDDKRTGRLEDSIHYKIQQEIDERLKQESIIIDSLCNTKNKRHDYRSRHDRIGYHHNYQVICFLFDSQCQTCYERMQTRKKDPPEQIYHLSSLIYSLLEFETPLNNDLTPEKGLDLILTVDINGTIKSAHPLETYEKIKEKRI